MMWLTTVLSLSVLWLIGTVTLGALRALPRDSWTHAVAAGFATGAAVLAIIGSGMIAVGVRLSLVPFYILLPVLGALAVRAGVRMPRVTRSRDRAARTVLVLAALVLIFVAAASLRDRLWWDGWAIWALKARVLFLDGTFGAGFVGAGGAYGFTHLDYPLAVPLVDWWAWRHNGVVSASVASFTGAVWFALLPMLLWTGLHDRVGEKPAALAALGMALFWPIALYATGGTADVVIAVALLGALIELNRVLYRSDAGARVRLAMFLTIGVLAKNEGLAIAVVIAAVAALTLLRRGERRVQWFAPLAVPFLAAAPWWLFVASLDVREPMVVPTALSTIPERVLMLLARIGTLMTSSAWLPVPFIAGAGILSAVRGRDGRLMPGWLILGAYFSVVAAVYVLTPHDLSWLITTSLPRVLSVFVAPLVFLSVAAAARPAAAEARA